MKRHRHLFKDNIRSSLTATQSRRAVRSNAPAGVVEAGLYGVPPNGRVGSSVPKFDPYEDEWGNQLEED